MVPTEFMTAAVAMLTDALPEFLYFGDKLFTCHLIKVGVHSVVTTNSAVDSSRLDDLAAQRLRSPAAEARSDEGIQQHSCWAVRLSR